MKNFLEFSNLFYGFEIFDKKTNEVIPKYILFWKGYDYDYIKNKYLLKIRK